MGFETMGFDEMAKELDLLSDTDGLAEEMLKAASPVLKRELKNQIQAMASKGYAHGDLKESIEADKPRKNIYGHYVAITAEGKDRKGVRNNEKLAYLQYGTCKQAARPVITKAISNAERECLDIMQKKFDGRIES